MTDDRKDQGLERRAKAVFDDSVERLDAASLSRLNRVRQEALSRTRKRPLARWAPVGGLATAAAVAVLLLQSPGVVEPPAGTDAADFEILMSDDSLEMLEDLEFYSWLDLATADDGIG